MADCGEYRQVAEGYWGELIGIRRCCNSGKTWDIKQMGEGTTIIGVKVVPLYIPAALVLDSDLLSRTAPARLPKRVIIVYEAGHDDECREKNCSPDGRYGRCSRDDC